jgi:hypothetical protein
MICGVKPSCARRAIGSSVITSRTLLTNPCASRPLGTENGALAMMVISYWEQACAYLNHGLLHEDLFFETNGEFYGVWDRMKAIVPECRQRFASKLFAGHLEEAAKKYEKWIESRSPGHIAAMQQMMKQMRDQFSKAAKA